MANYRIVLVALTALFPLSAHATNFSMDESVPLKPTKPWAIERPYQEAIQNLSTLGGDPDTPRRHLRGTDCAPDLKPIPNAADRLGKSILTWANEMGGASDAFKTAQGNYARHPMIMQTGQRYKPVIIEPTANRPVTPPPVNCISSSELAPMQSENIIIPLANPAKVKYSAPVIQSAEEAPAQIIIEPSMPTKPQAELRPIGQPVIQPAPEKKTEVLNIEGPVIMGVEETVPLTLEPHVSAAPSDDTLILAPPPSMLPEQNYMAPKTKAYPDNFVYRKIDQSKSLTTPAIGR